MRSPRELLTRCYGLSLSDAYWIKPDGSSMTWGKVNFFDNDFSDDVGNILLGNKHTNDNINYYSPDITTDGALKKRWIISDGKRCLLKAGEEYSAEPFNEKIASVIMNRLDIPHVNYELIWLDGKPYSICEDFITPETELVPAWRILQTQKQPNHENEYQFYVRLCSELGIEITHALDQLIVLDYIIANEDRHFNNFGLIRNPDTLEWINAAPIYDSGSSLGYNRPAKDIGMTAICKPFKKTHNKELRLVTSFDWIDFSKLRDITEEISDIFSDKNSRQIFGDERCKEVPSFLKDRINSLEMIASAK